MRHRKRRGKLNRTSSHRVAMFANMAVSLLQHEQIVTTIEKARALRPIVERMVTAARDNSLHVRRQLLSKLRDQNAANKLLTVVGPRYATRPGGYLRIIKYKLRIGDKARLAVIEFVDRDIRSKGLDFAAQLNEVN